MSGGFAEFAVWWTTDAEADWLMQLQPERPYYGGTEGLFNSEFCYGPTYIREQMEDRNGRAGRGRLWVAPALESEIETLPGLPRAFAAEHCAGIVVRRTDLDALCGTLDFLGVVTDCDGYVLYRDTGRTGRWIRRRTRRPRRAESLLCRRGAQSQAGGGMMAEDTAAPWIVRNAKGQVANGGPYASEAEARAACVYDDDRVELCAAPSESVGPAEAASSIEERLEADACGVGECKHDTCALEREAASVIRRLRGVEERAKECLAMRVEERTRDARLYRLNGGPMLDYILEGATAAEGATK